MIIINLFQLIIVGLTLYKVKSQCFYPDFIVNCPNGPVASLFIEKTAISLNYPAVCSYYNEGCYLEAKKCTTNPADEYFKYATSFESFKYICTGEGKQGLSTYQNCLNDQTFQKKFNSCSLIPELTDLSKACNYFNLIGNCVTQSSDSCQSSRFVCSFLKIISKPQLEIFNCTLDICPKDANDAEDSSKIIVYTTIGVLVVLSVIMTTIILICVNRN